MANHVGLPEARPPIKLKCVICTRVGKRENWDERFLLVSPSGTAHFQSLIADENTVCGKDATGNDWWWPF